MVGGGSWSYPQQLLCEERLMELGFFSLKKEIALGYLTVASSVHGAASLFHQSGGVRFLTVMLVKRMSGDRYKLK